jgi:hypothetical protein
MVAHHERMMVMMDSRLEKIDVLVTVIQERLSKMDTPSLDTNQENWRMLCSSRMSLKKRSW